MRSRSAFGRKGAENDRMQPQPMREQARPWRKRLPGIIGNIASRPSPFFTRTGREQQLAKTQTWSCSFTVADIL